MHTTTPKSDTFSVALLAGGKSSRMGRDKGLISFMGKPLYLYILDQIQGLSDDIFLISNNPVRYSATTYSIYPDKIHGIGALGGIHSALSYAQHELCFVFACDMPFVNRGLFELVISEVVDFDVAIPELSPEMLEPFRAIYRKTCLQAIESAIHSGERKAIGFLPNVKTNRIPRSAVVQLDPDLESFLNINTPEDWARIEAIAKARNKQLP